MKKPAILLDIYVHPKLSEARKNRLKPDFGDAFFDIAKDFEWSAKSLKASTKIAFIFYNTVLKKKHRKIQESMEELARMVHAPTELTWKMKEKKLIIPPLPKDIQDSFKRMKL